jgi:hypothetical protein
MSAIEGKPDGRRTRPGPPHLTLSGLRVSIQGFSLDD